MAARLALNGRYAEASIGGVLLALLFDWKVEVDTSKFDAAGYGDNWRYEIPIISGWRFSAKGYVVPGFPAQYIKSLWRAGGQQLYFTVAGFSGDVATGTKIFEGLGFPVKGEITVPMQMVEQQFELVGYGPPTVGIS